jgi:DNA-directed RNA polymerase specialized sigma24 family protein
MTPQPATSTLVTRLNTEWMRVSHRTVNIASGTHPLQGGDVRSGAELLAQIQIERGPEQDALLYSLITLGRHGNTFADRVLLQALFPAAHSIARRVRVMDQFERADRSSYAISAAWESIRTYRLHLQSKVMGNLTMGVLHHLSTLVTPGAQEIAVRTFTVPDEVLDLLPDQHPAQIRPEVEVAQTLRWAVNHGVLTAGETALLVRAALDEQPHLMIAADLGLSVEGVRTRLTRIRKKLSTAVRGELSLTGSTPSRLLISPLFDDQLGCSPLMGN